VKLATDSRTRRSGGRLSQATEDFGGALSGARGSLASGTRDCEVGEYEATARGTWIPSPTATPPTGQIRVQAPAGPESLPLQHPGSVVAATVFDAQATEGCPVHPCSGVPARNSKARSTATRRYSDDMVAGRLPVGERRVKNANATMFHCGKFLLRDRRTGVNMPCSVIVLQIRFCASGTPFAK
jgi:hypothetical protein